jgi:hypothetical protein
MVAFLFFHSLVATTVIAICALPIWAVAQIDLKNVLSGSVASAAAPPPALVGKAISDTVVTPQVRAQLLAYAPDGVGMGSTATTSSVPLLIS